jgi:hypothetical protein
MSWLVSWRQWLEENKPQRNDFTEPRYPKMHELVGPTPSLRPKEEPTPVEVAMNCGAVGLLFAAVDNAMANHDKGFRGIFTRSGGLVATFGEFSVRVTGLKSKQEIGLIPKCPSRSFR